MPSEFTVFHVADVLLAAGERLSLRSVRARIPAGVSPRDVCKHLSAWRKRRGYDPRLEPTDMSKALRDKTHALATEI